MSTGQVGGRSGPSRTRNPRGEGQRLRQEILDAAGRLLEEGGHPEEMSLRAIAREAGITSAAVYRQFEDKAELMWTLLDDVYETLAEELNEARRSAPADDAWAGLWGTVDTYCRFAAAAPRRYELLFRVGPTLAPRDESGSHPTNKVLEAWRRAVAPCLDETAADQLTVDEATKLLWTGLHGQFGLWHNAPYAIDRSELTAMRDALLFAIFRRR
ncbi:TetR/AcrR family transcriptional regulator [Streptomyces sp. NPDC096311]|uniref:TetR/AcrR family transcriptional regulator n=1 Tax=Streptomyces sp. NPDC096311 TaxID=3366083 RepID=UPI0038070907